MYSTHKVRFFKSVPIDLSVKQSINHQIVLSSSNHYVIILYHYVNIANLNITIIIANYNTILLLYCSYNMYFKIKILLLSKNV